MEGAPGHNPPSICELFNSDFAATVFEKLSFPTLQNQFQRRIIFKLVVPLKLLGQNGHKRSNPEIDVTVNNDLSISLQPFQSLLSTVGGCYRLHIQENTNQYAIVNPSQ